MLRDRKGRGYEPTLRTVGHALAAVAALAAFEERKRGKKRTIRDVIAQDSDEETPLGVLAPVSARQEFTTTAKGRPSSNGDRVLGALYAKLDEIDALEYPRSHHQVKFHDCFIRACLRIIYGAEYERMESYLLAEMDVEQFRTEVMIVTPRRFGKTYSVAQFCAAFATSVMGKEVAADGQMPKKILTRHTLHETHHEANAENCAPQRRRSAPL